MCALCRLIPASYRIGYQYTVISLYEHGLCQRKIYQKYNQVSWSEMSGRHKSTKMVINVSIERIALHGGAKHGSVNAVMIMYGKYILIDCQKYV